MSATKILWGQIAIVLLIVLTTTWAATQWTAWRLGFQPQLAQLYQLTPSNGNFCCARPQKRESNQRRPIANRL